MVGATIRKNVIYIILAVLVLAGVLLFAQSSSFSPSKVVTGTTPSAGETTTQKPTGTAQQQPQQQTQQETQKITGTVAAVKEFTVHGKSFEFDTKTITVGKGDKVKIIFVSDDVSHDICVEGYACSQIVSKGQTATLEFTAQESGKPKFYCSVDSHRLFGMEGNFVIQ